MMATAAFCPKCGEANMEKSNFCQNCGELLALDAEAEAAAPAQSFQSTSAGPEPFVTRQSYSPAPGPAAANVPAKRDYSALRGVAALCKLISWIFVGLAILQVIGGFIVLFDSFLTGMAVIMGAVVFGAVGYVFWRIIAESILVILDIESNTRATALALAQGRK